MWKWIFSFHKKWKFESNLFPWRIIALENWSCLNGLLSWFYHYYFYCTLQVIFHLCQWHISTFLRLLRNCEPGLCTTNRVVCYWFQWYQGSSSTIICNPVLFTNQILSNKLAVTNNRHSDSVPLLSAYTPVCGEEGCSQLLMCSYLKMKQRHGNFPFTYQCHYLLNGLNPEVLS